MSKGTLENLDEFQGWDDIETQEDFFSMEEEQETEEVETSEEETQEEETSEEEEEETQEEDFFSETSEEEEEETEEEEEETQSSTVIATANFLKEKGLLDFELEEGEELTDELAEEIIEDKFDESVESRMKELFEELPPVVKQLNNYVIKGGDVRTFLQTLIDSDVQGIEEDIDLEQEENQELVTREMLKAEGYDADYIDTQIEFLKDSGKLKMVSGTKFNKWKKERQEKAKELADQQELDRQEQKRKERKAKSDSIAYFKENEAVGELTFTKEDKKQLPSYMNDKTVKLQNGGTLTQMQKELFYDIPKNKEAFTQLAVLMRNRNEDGTFNFESIIEQTKTKVVKGVKEKVRRSKNQTPGKSKGRKVNTNKRLADYFN